MRKKATLQNELAVFKKACRRVGNTCIAEDQDWILRTCYSRANRLAGAGVSNKHAGVQGMPVVTDVEKELIMEAILALRGKASKKQKDYYDSCVGS